ncbi:MAG: hypothetical protein PHU25_02180 [Deltaproteobacteria bacterium]|nr:hypothetical protein [Deltaproteobacteria bacterium]
MRTFAIAAFLAALVAACGTTGTANGASEAGSVKAAPAPAPAAKAAPAPAKDVPAAKASFSGSFESGACGARNYPRKITFRADGGFTALDMVAPCPPGARCVWSGIIEWSGSWKLALRRVELAVSASAGKQPEHVPAEFEIMGEDPWSVAEKDGTTLCPYKKVD